MTSGASKTALQGIYDAAIRNREVRAWKRRQRPSIGLYDGDWTFRGQVVGEHSASFDWKLNDTGAGQIVLPYDHHLALWAMSFWKRGTSNVHVRVDKDGERWTGRLSEVVTEQNDDGERVTTLNFLHDYEELKHLPVWANPLTPAFVQFPKTFLIAGPSAYILKLTLFLNLVRLNMSLWQLPDDPLSFSGWAQGLNYKEWPILVKPGSLILDDSQWTIINSRFKNFHDLAEPILADGHLMVEMRRWFNGDPQPWPGAGLYRDGQLIIDIVDKSGWFDETAVGGTIAGGLLRTGLNVAENLIDETRMHLNRIDDAPEYEVAGWLGVAPKQPWVTYRTNGDANTAESTSFTWQPATVSQITTGGHSSPGVNEAMSVSVQLAFNLIGSFMLQPGLGSVADSVLQPLYEDTLFAFMSFKSPFRTMRMGWSHYYENFESGGDKAYTLSSVIAMRKGFWDTRERTLHQMKIGDGAPYLVGSNGEGHFSLGDRVGGEIPGPRDGRVVVEQVTGLSLSWDADTPHEWMISTGDMSADHDPIEYLISKVADLSEAAQDLGVM